MSGGEAIYAEEPTLEWLQEVGWTVLHGATIAPGAATAERASWDEVVLVDRLRGAVAELNPTLTSAAVEMVVVEVRRTAAPEAILDHEAFHALLVNGVPVIFVDASGNELSMRARLVDFADPRNNDFLAVNQFRIVLGKKNRRPDVVLFVNGIPLGQVELKNPVDEAATSEAAVNQLAHYVQTIPNLYRFVEIVVVSDLVQARMGTITTPAEHFAEWRSMDPAADAGKPHLEVMLRGACAPNQFLDLVENFVLFESDGARRFKVLAKYHQVDAVNRAIEATVTAMGSDGRAGVVWHTQGAGKSYTMVFYAAKARRDTRFANPTIIALTDRIDLDDQLWETFSKQASLVQSVEQADSINMGPQSLHALLQVPAGGIVFTTIQKFAVPAGAKEMPVLSVRANVIVMADEAHRTQYDEFARNLTKALPNATRIAFTGTPIERGDRSTKATFGDYISVYRITRSVEDGATVPIFYESRAIMLSVADADLLKKVEDVLEGEEAVAATKLVTSWSRLEKVVGADERILRVADDVATHFGRRLERLAGKGLVVGMSRRICAALTGELKTRLGDKAVTCVMSASATDPAEISQYRRSKEELRQVSANFKDVDHALKLVVVRDMWLTGFDVPSLHTMYIDKPMRDQGLLQAIARVNRVFRDKPGGLVVDYIGIGEDLRAALPAYADEDVDDVAVPVDEILIKLREKREVLDEFFHGLDYRNRAQLLPSQRAQLLIDGHARVVVEDETTKRYLDEYAAFARLFALVSTRPEAVVMEDDAKFFGELARLVRKYTPPPGQASHAAEQAVRQFFAEGLGAGEVIDIFTVAGKERPELSILSDDFLDDITKRINQPNLQIALLRKLLNDEVRSQARQNSLQAKEFSKELVAALRRYAQRQLSSAEVVERLIELAKRMRAARHRHEELGLSIEEAAFYDAVAGGAGALAADPKLVDLAKGLVTSIRADLTVDWADRESAEAAIRVKVKRLLRRSGYQPPERANGAGLDRVCQLVLEQARQLYRYWPEVDDRLIV